MTRTFAARATAGLLAIGLITTAVAARADDEPPGWGMAIAARVIGEKCQGALKEKEIAALNTYITDQFNAAVAGSSQSPAWWADLRDKLEQSYVEKYSDPANCTEEARDEAEELVSAVEDVQEDAAKK
ncbi:MAG: hypothetical protein ACT4N2_10810 [Hyphomicrobium sp.]